MDKQLRLSVFLHQIFQMGIYFLPFREVGDEAKSRALDNLGRIHARIGNFQDAID